MLQATLSSRKRLSWPPKKWSSACSEAQHNRSGSVGSMPVAQSAGSSASAVDNLVSPFKKDKT